MSTTTKRGVDAMSVIDEITDPTTALAVGLSDVSETMSQLAQMDLHGVDATALHTAIGQIEALGRQVEALNAKALAAAEADGRWATDGARSFPAWVRAKTGRLDAAARRKVKQARMLRDHLPATAAALQAGTIGPDHVAALVRHATDTPQRLTQLADPTMGEAFLIDQATRLDAGQFTTVVKHWAVRTDPDAADRAWKEDTAHEELVLAKTTGGYHVKGWLSQINGELLTTAIDARTGVPSAGDQRSTAQRRAAGLVALARLALDSGKLQPGARIRPHLAITADLQALLALIAASAPEVDGHTGDGHTGDSDHNADTSSTDQECVAATNGAGNGTKTPAAAPEAVITTTLDSSLLKDAPAATLPDGSPIPHALFARLVCQSQIHRVIFGADSEVLDVGREERLFTAAQTRAVIARDKHCQYPHCHAPPNEGEIHHSLWWYAHNGPTDVKKGVLLCWYHHDYVHQREITIERHKDRWKFTRPNGTRIGETQLNN